MDSALTFLSYIGWVLLAIMILVFIHELGHFLFAKLFGMRVDRFSVGFPPRLFGKKVGDTDYMVGLVPLGGYVKISGMVDESMDADYATTPPEPWEFRSKPVWQRSVVIVAGVVFNMILAAIVFISIKATLGDLTIPSIGAMQVEEASVAYDMGLRTGDVLVNVNGKPVASTRGISDIQEMLLANPLTLSVEREGETLTFTGPSDLFTQLSRREGRFGIAFNPAVVGDVGADSGAEEAGLVRGDRIVGIGADTVAFWTDITDIMGASTGEPVAVRFLRADSLGSATGATALYRHGDGTVYERVITPRKSGDSYLIGIGQYYEYRTYSILQAIPAGISETWMQTRVIATSLTRVFTGRENFRENVGGPIMIAKLTKEAADKGSVYFWNIVAMLSITLAFINILPIPALDGGHLVFLIYEGITRREPSLKIRMAMQQVGMLLLLGFMAFVIFNDILKL